ncbi:putative transferase [Bufonid herpesvirus 1]|uniref:putative transferase n=1 Tax=Bufonid herpesvirus 1 TaxID=2282206 RepID=UPI000EB766B7|nr:putative transferase [Bufonid herpesvirus 1]AXF48507.1 putative transferase [Bufonid herpesvirus 1]
MVFGKIIWLTVILKIAECSIFYDEIPPGRSFTKEEVIQREKNINKYTFDCSYNDVQAKKPFGENTFKKTLNCKIVVRDTPRFALAEQCVAQYIYGDVNARSQRRYIPCELEDGFVFEEIPLYAFAEDRVLFVVCLLWHGKAVCMKRFFRANYTENRIFAACGEPHPFNNKLLNGADSGQFSLGQLKIRVNGTNTYKQGTLNEKKMCCRWAYKNYTASQPTVSAVAFSRHLGTYVPSLLYNSQSHTLEWSVYTTCYALDNYTIFTATGTFEKQKKKKMEKQKMCLRGVRATNGKYTMVRKRC